MNTRMGLAVVRGLQGPAGHKYMKLYACAKHFAVHSGPEKTRHHFDIETCRHVICGRLICRHSRRLCRREA